MNGLPSLDRRGESGIRPDIQVDEGYPIAGDHKDYPY
jgi:hypothetical protein